MNKKATRKKFFGSAGLIVFSSLLLTSPFPVLAVENNLTENVSIELDDSQIPVEKPVKPAKKLDVDTNATFTKIGPQVFNGTALAAAFGKSPDNQPYMYVLQHGTPSALSIINLASGKTEKIFTLENSTSAWGIDVDENQKVWIGGTSSGHLYEYDPQSQNLKDYGNVLKHGRDTAILDLDAAGGRIYGSTAYEGTVFSYIPEIGERIDYDQISKGKQFAKSVYFDDELQSIFIGIGSKAELIRYDIRTKIRYRFLPWEYRNEKYISDIQIVDQYLFARLDPSHKILVFDKKTLKLLDVIDATSKTISAKSPDGDRVFYTNNGELYAYNYKSKEIVKIKAPLKGMDAINLGFVELNQKEYPGYTLVGLLSNNGNYFLYNLQTGKFSLEKINLAQLPVTLYTMTENPEKDKIIINGFMSGGLTVYDIETGKTTEIKGISQIESMVFFNNKLFLGTYPKAKLLEIDLPRAWNSSSIKELQRYSELGQERTTALLGVSENNKLFIGTYPETSTGGGLLSVYDLKTNKAINYENYIPDQSIISLTNLNGFVYGGTTVFANHKKSAENATFFRFPINNPGQKEKIKLPFKATMVNSLINRKNDKTIWGMADGKLFKYEIESGDFDFIEIVPAISGRFKNAKILFGNDGNIYGTVEGILFKANPDTLDVTILKKEGAHDLAIDKYGNLYFRNEADMWKYHYQEEGSGPN
ncbi:WD40 repeat domain-containing protein [Bacillus methanolicus]|uniref:Secreted protein n=1 Tax=Bacillus methanolicus (strain MGA3 / ATCC 53907) TaxID=796606 RepID=I3EB41_BACMM|nr:WD40 repeat domain-containing protein [Bacillus methanolicus]AIE61394.1 hypothetical protein BMMGA3_15185 [Bacillus methanolicus MGA3]EIJ83712.1 hypothetical protein MGA3_00370 [Bacillus methanolicus MGA3]